LEEATIIPERGRARLRAERRRAADAFNAWTAPSRERNAAAIYLLGPRRPRPYDGLLARIYFAITPFVWREVGETPGHLDPLLSGVEASPAPSRVLDVGVGAGHSSAAIADRWPNATVVGVDLSGPMVREAQRLHQRPNLSYRQGSTARLPFADGSFDLVTVLNAVPDLDEIHRLMAPRASAVVASSFHRRPPAEHEGVILARWTQAGFERVNCGDGPHGHWDLFQRSQ